MKLRFYFSHPPSSDNFNPSFIHVDDFGPERWNAIDPSGKTRGKRLQMWIRPLRFLFTLTFARGVMPS